MFWFAEIFVLTTQNPECDRTLVGIPKGILIFRHRGWKIYGDHSRTAVNQLEARTIITRSDRSPFHIQISGAWPESGISLASRCVIPNQLQELSRA
jgi:hypothetical protein